jgi:ubiquitin carboxyl-terminal hydrolase 4/11/15
VCDKKKYRPVRNKRNNKEVLIYDCLELFRKKEKLEENNTWYCNKCKTHVQATKKMEIYKAPECLILVLKRFRTIAR